MRLHQTLKQLRLPRRGHRFDPYRQQLTQRAGNRGLVHRQGHRAAMPEPIVGAAHRRRQGNQTPCMELAQQRTGRHVLVRPPCVDPIPVATQFLGQPCSMPIGVVGQQLTDKPEVLFCDGTALYSCARFHGQDNSPFQTGSPVKNAVCTGLLRSYYTPFYVVEKSSFAWLAGGSAGDLQRRCTRPTNSLAASLSKMLRLNTHGPSRKG